jgi:hypothetical protein
MNTVRKLAIGVGAVSAIASVAHAQNSSSTSASGSATVIQPISISPTSPLAFGTIVKPNDASVATVTVDPGTGVRTIAGGAAAGLGTTTAAGFAIVGEGGSAYNVSIPTQINLVSGSNTLVVAATNNSTATILGGAGASVGTTSTNTFGVGGSFNISNGTPSGAYTGTFTVTATYQ